MTLETGSNEKKDMLKLQDQKDVILHNKRLTQLRVMGIFQEMSELLTNAGGIHVDMSSFLGSLSGPLSKNFDTMHILTSQRNPVAAEMLMTILRKAEENKDGKIERYSSRQMSMVEEEDGSIRRDFSLQYPDLKNTNFKDLSPSIWVINEEMDDMRVTREILGEQKIDSASLNFPMYNFARSMETPYQPAFVENNEVWRRLADIMHRELRGAYRFATEKVKTGGRLLVGLDTTVSDLKIIVSSTREKLMQQYSKCWDDDKCQTLDVRSKGKTISLIRFQRNAKPAGETL